MYTLKVKYQRFEVEEDHIYHDIFIFETRIENAVNVIYSPNLLKSTI